MPEKVKIALIVPYRNREQQLKEFRTFFKNYLKGYDYKIFLIEQSEDHLKFNRGILLNIGYKYALEEGYNTFIYHDIDLLPPDSLKDMYTMKNEDDIIHIAYSWSRYNKNLGNESYFGGITRLPSKIFKAIGGFPIMYWGWGGEDDEVYRRVQYCIKEEGLKTQIIRPLPAENETLNDLEDLSLSEKLSILKKNDLKCTDKDVINNLYDYYRPNHKLFKELDNLEKLMSKKGSLGLEEMNYKLLNKIEDKDKDKDLFHIKVNIALSILGIAKDPSLLLDKLNNKYPSVFASVIKNTYITDFTTRKFVHSLNLLFIEDKDPLKNKNTAWSENPEFPWFNQNIFHAGSVEQFMQYSNQEHMTAEKKLKVNTTFNYMFSVVKKGIYVQIRNNILKVFLPFSNANYKNNWAKNLKVPQYFKRNPSAIKNKEISSMINDKKIPDICAFALQNDAFILEKEKVLINTNIDEWYANNYFFRNTVYNDPDDKRTYGHVDEGDKSIYLMLKFLSEFLYAKRVQDSDFFINARDMPVLKVSDSGSIQHPYPLLYTAYSYFNENKDLSSKYVIDNMLPIFSGAVTNNYNDISMPTDDDIRNNMFSKSTDTDMYADDNNTTEVKIPSWSSRKNKVIFRGSATGRMIDIYNPRIQIAAISKLRPDLIDAEITSFNKRMKVIDDKCTCDYINLKHVLNTRLLRINNIQNSPIRISDLGSKNSFMPMSTQASYKYTIDVQGHSAAYRLPTLLSYGFVVLKIDSPFKLWFEDDKSLSFKGLYYNDINDTTVKDIQYVKIPVSLDNIINTKKLFETIEFLNNNDKYAKKISENAVEYHKKYLTKNGMFDYFIKKIEQ